jgi:hypothetical protein
MTVTAAATVTNVQFDYLLAIAVDAIEIDGIALHDITPSAVYYWIDDDTLQDVWDALTYKEQNEVCYDLRDQVYDALALYQEYLRSDEYNELQYI